MNLTAIFLMELHVHVIIIFVHPEHLVFINFITIITTLEGVIDY